MTTVVVLISGAFVQSRLIYERCIHLGDTFAYRSAHSNLFLTLLVIHKLKTLICVRATSLSRPPWASSCGELRNVSHNRLPYHAVPYGFECNILTGKMLMTNVSVTKEVSCIAASAASVLLGRGGGDGLVLKLTYINCYNSKGNYFLTSHTL